MGRQRLGKFRASLGKYLTVKRGLPCTMRQFMVRPARLRLNVPISPGADRGWSKCRTSGIVIAILALYHENRYLERKWYSRPAGSVLRMGGARPPRRGMPAGVESRAGTNSQPMPPYRLPRLLARTARLFRCVAPRQEGAVRL